MVNLYVIRTTRRTSNVRNWILTEEIVAIHKTKKGAVEHLKSIAKHTKDADLAGLENVSDYEDDIDGNGYFRFRIDARNGKFIESDYYINKIEAEP